mmetsp:Transcript_30604/g.39470  ORF Transcript_30604/g.39470 Transcript_30604/m.39470 type:complete len:344 (-) Transcript_30604:244-1275(-)
MAYQPDVQGAVSKVSAHIKEGREEKPTRMKIFNDKLFDTLLATPDPASNVSVGLQRMGTNDELGVGKSAKTISAERKRLKNQQEAKQRRFERHREAMDRLQADNAQRIKKKLADQEANKEQHYADLRHEVEMGRQLTEEVDKMIALYDTSRKLKAEKQFDEWNNGVYGHIQDRICKDLDSQDYKDLQKKRNEAFQQYLDTSNKKGGAVFRDIIIESEYDPLALNRTAIKVKGHNLKDPTTRVVDRHHEERSLLAEGKLSKKHTQREVLDVQLWGTGKIESTSHGFMHKMMHRTPTEFDGNLTHSTIKMDHYNIDKGAEHTDKEFPVGKRIFKEYRASDQIQLG